MFKQFDIVNIKTTKNIKWLSGPPDAKITPNGSWSVVGIIGQDLIICKDKTLVRVPIDDVIKIGDYNLNKLFNKRKKENGKKEQQ